MRKTATQVLLSVSLVATTGGICLPASAQWCDLSGSPMTTLRDPLIWGATSTAPLSVAPEGQPPPIGQGFAPPPVTPGMSLEGPPTLIPSVPIAPANDIENPSYQINWDPANESSPGQLGPSLTAAPPPSTPGTDPGMLPGPLDFYPPPAAIVNINPDGGIEGSAPTQRWGGQQSHDYGLYRHRGTQTDDMAQEEQGNDTYDGGAHARASASDTQDLYGSRFPLKQGKPMPDLGGVNSQSQSVTNAFINNPQFNQ